MAEHESKIQVVRFAGMWKDLGTWNTLTEAMDESIIGKGELNDKCSGVHIINEMDISSVDAIYIVCGRTDMRKSIDGLCAIIQEQFSMEIDHALFLFCGRRCDRIKAILKEPDGIVMIYKRLTAQGSYRWPRNKSEVRNLTWREFDWLMSGIDIEQPKAIKAT